MASSSSDPLHLAELEPARIQEAVDGKSKSKGKPTELEQAKEARLAAKESRLKQTVPPSAPSAPTPAPEKPKDRTVLLDKITAYRERFAHLKKRNTLSIKSSIDEIEDELHYIEMQLGAGQQKGNLAGTAFYMTMVGLERSTDVWNPLGLNLTGLGSVAQENMVQFQPILDELMIKHNAGTYTSPEWRLVLAVGATVVTVNAANQNPEMARAVKKMHAKYNGVAPDDL
jgi:hypothetical protein